MSGYENERYESILDLQQNRTEWGTENNTKLGRYFVGDVLVAAFNAGVGWWP